MSTNKPKCLNRSGKLLKNWNEYKESFINYLKSAGIQESDNKQAGALFLATIGLYGREIANELKLLNLTKDNIRSSISMQDVYRHFDNHCQINYNLTSYRYQFFNIKQGTEDFEAFLSSLTEISKNCEFGDLSDSLLMIQIISGISNKEVQDDLYSVLNDLDLAKTIQKCRGRKPKKSPKASSDTKNPDYIDAGSKLAKNNDGTSQLATTSRKRNSAERENIISENSPSTSKIPRKTTSDKKSNAVSETENEGAENNDKRISKKRHISTERNETNVKNKSQEDYHTKPRNLSTFAGNSKLARNESENESSEEGEIREPVKIIKNMHYSCRFCGRNHGPRFCPDFNEICQMCRKRGHIARVCRFGPWNKKL